MAMILERPGWQNKTKVQRKPTKSIAQFPQKSKRTSLWIKSAPVHHHHTQAGHEANNPTVSPQRQQIWLVNQVGTECITITHKQVMKQTIQQYPHKSNRSDLCSSGHRVHHHHTQAGHEANDPTVSPQKQQIWLVFKWAPSASPSHTSRSWSKRSNSIPTKATDLTCDSSGHRVHHHHTQVVHEANNPTVSKQKKTIPKLRKRWWNEVEKRFWP